MATNELEDAVTFLENAKKRFPNITALLTTNQLVALDMDPGEPFNDRTVNEDFIKLVESYFVTKHSIDQTKGALRQALMEPLSRGKEVDVQAEQEVITCLEKVQDRLLCIQEAKLRVTEVAKGEGGLPRIIRVCRKLHLNKKETLVMVFALCCQVCDARVSGASRFGRFMGSSSFYGNDTLSVCKACDLKIGEMVSFLSSDREHMKLGLFPDVQQGYLLHSAITFDEVSCKALIGAPLKENEFLKIEQTPLADVMAMETGNEHLRSHEAHPTAPSPEGGEKENREKEVVIPDAPAAPESLDSVEEEHGDDRVVPQDVIEESVSEAPPADLPGAPVPTLTDLVPPEELPPGEKEEGKVEVHDLDDLIRLERQKEKLRKEAAPEAADDQDTSGDKLLPYKTDLEYLDDHFQLVAQKLKVKSMESRIEMEAQYDDEMRDTRTLRQKREAESKAKVLRKKCEKRITLTRQAGTWIPRLERMASSRGLCEFEKNVLLTLIGFIIQPTKINPFEVMGFGGAGGGASFTMGELLRLFCSSLREQIKHRMYFYKSATLIHEGMVIVHNSGITGDPTTAKVEIDRRMLDFCVGLDTEFSEIVEGSHLYYPKTKFEQVILSKEQKQLILNTVSNFEAFKRCRRKMGLDDAITYGAGMVMLFHGAPGTGKTMMANALANKLSKKVLLINFPSLGSFSAGENFKFIFREAKINDAILFFDECEAIFESRDKGSHDVNMLLTEVERHDGLIIMATNRPYDLDEAMHRRIMIAIEFRQPDHLLRKAIWESHIPEQMSLSDDINLNDLSLRYELTGGFIKNAILSALSIAVSRDGDSPKVCQKDLLQGANLQLRGRLRMKDFHRRVVPNAGLDRVIVPDHLAKSLREIVQFEKARSVLFGQWGFGASEQQGITVLLHGHPGTGKTLAAMALGYEVGRPLKVVNCGELLSKWVGESAKNIDAIFEEARHSDAILVFDEAEGLFGSRTTMMTSTDRYANVDVGVLLYHIERFPGIIILTTNLIDNIDKAFFRRLRFVLQFDVPPYNLRVKLWKLHIPEETPVADDVDFERLARHDMTGGNIKSSVFRAASRAALRSEDQRKVFMEDLEDAAEEEIGKSTKHTSFRRQDSDTAAMYN